MHVHVDSHDGARKDAGIRSMFEAWLKWYITASENDAIRKFSPRPPSTWFSPSDTHSLRHAMTASLRALQIRLTQVLCEERGVAAGSTDGRLLAFGVTYGRMNLYLYLYVGRAPRRPGFSGRTRPRGIL
jgi:hypothetical protein